MFLCEVNCISIRLHTNGTETLFPGGGDKISNATAQIQQAPVLRSSSDPSGKTNVPVPGAFLFGRGPDRRAHTRKGLASRQDARSASRNSRTHKATFDETLPAPHRPRECRMRDTSAVPHQIPIQKSLSAEAALERVPRIMSSAALTRWATSPMRVLTHRFYNIRENCGAIELHEDCSAPR